MDNYQTTTTDNTVLNLKHLILILKKYYKATIINWKIILFCIILSISYFLYQAFKTPITYTASLSFMLNENEGGVGLGGAAAILGSIIGDEASYSLDKILELSKSNRIINESLLGVGVVNGKVDFFANHLIELYNLKETDWQNDTSLNKGFRFTHNEIEKFSRREASALKSITVKLVSGYKSPPLFSTSYSKQAQIMRLNLKTINEDLSISLLKQIYDNLGTFYINKSIEKQKFTYEVIIDKADSLKSLLNGKEYAKAKFSDSNRGLITETTKIPSNRLTRDVNILNIMYSEAIRNAEVADFAIKSKVPFIQAIDVPYAPIKPERKSKTIALLLGGIIGLSIGIFYSIIKTVLKEALE